MIFLKGVSFRRRLGAVLPMLLALVAGTGCGAKAKMSVQVKKGPDKPKPTAVVKKKTNDKRLTNSKIELIWDTAQSSSFFRFRVVNLTAGPSHSIEIHNESNGATVLNISTGDVPTDSPGYWITQEAESVLVTIDPGEEAVAAALKAGVNSLTAFVDGATDDDDKFNLSLENFDIFSVGSSYFTEGQSGTAHGGQSLQAWTGPLAASTVVPAQADGRPLATKDTGPYLNSSFLDILSDTQN